MSLQSTIALIFPAGVLRRADPETGCAFEVHGLPKSAVPQNCEVLASGQFQFSAGQQRRESFLVKRDDFVLFFRICPVPPDSGYAEIVECRSPPP